MNIIEARGISKSFNQRKIIDNFDIDIEENSFTVIMGPSGSGKTTLLNLLGILEKADKGIIKVAGLKNVKPFSRKAEMLLRNKIGFLFQEFALVENETVFYNLKLALEYVKGDKKSLIKNALDEVGLSNYESKMIYECSGGEQQRIALARLLLKPCEIIMADEPTGSLDENNRNLVCEFLKELHRNGKTIIVVTHDPYIKQFATQYIDLKYFKV